MGFVVASHSSTRAVNSSNLLEITKLKLRALPQRVQSSAMIQHHSAVRETVTVFDSNASSMYCITSTSVQHEKGHRLRGASMEGLYWKGLPGTRHFAARGERHITDFSCCSSTQARAAVVLKRTKTNHSS